MYFRKFGRNSEGLSIIETFIYNYYLLPIKMKLKCNKCENEWDYKGKNPYYATCSRCLNKVKVVDPEVRNPPKEIRI